MTPRRVGILPTLRSTEARRPTVGLRLDIDGRVGNLPTPFLSPLGQA